ncbi:hypothetical protein KFL_002870070 [Klebsormidium nitens]|uniref:Uncharacterized protein n=1 Tax=Klebsormidium nitens TaxID=105231 RepID=A0A1Y1I7A3_KLENI|nr:hypothetical protein KFL_002870070 [Klebsormidium nitens]|eukprot:GAQ86403.1 hypothetical protein KFL_002870070 [Klebsormidium nitens]
MQFFFCLELHVCPKAVILSFPSTAATDTTPRAPADGKELEGETADTGPAIRFGTFGKLELELSPNLIATIDPNGNPEVMMLTFRNECQQSVVSPGGVTLKSRDGSLAPLVGGAYFLCAYGSYEIALVGGRRDLEGNSDNEAERLQEEEQRAKRLRMIGLFNKEDCTERDFEHEHLQSTAYEFFSKGVQARGRGEDASALEFFRVSAVAGSANGMEELARYYLAGTVCSKDVIAAQALLREASQHLIVDFTLLQNCNSKIAEMVDAKLPKATVPTVLELMRILTSKSSVAERIGASKMLSDLAKERDSENREHHLWLVRLLASENEVMQVAVADAVRVLAENGDIDPDLPGLIDMLVCLLTCERARAAARGSAAAALARVAYDHDPETQERIRAVPQVVDSLTMLLWTEDVELQDATARPLITLTNRSESGPRVLDTIAASFKPGHLARLIGFLNGKSVDCRP